MIDCVSWETSHLYGDALVAQHRLRHRVFVDRHGWDVPTHNGLEYDQFDTPAAVYLVWRDEVGEARGAARLIPTDQRYMMKTLWPHMIATRPLPQSPRVWEGTRLCVDQEMPARLRRRIIAELLLGCLEFGLRNDIAYYVILAPVAVLTRTYRAAGCSIEFLGPEQEIDGDVVAAAECLVSTEILDAVRKKNGVKGPVLRVVDRPHVAVGAGRPPAAIVA